MFVMFYNVFFMGFFSIKKCAVAKKKFEKPCAEVPVCTIFILAGLKQLAKA